MTPDIDHVMVATTDLDATRREFQSLGFTVTPRARHPDFGTANHLCVLQGCYIELLGMDPDGAPGAQPYAPIATAIAAGGGVPMVALSSGDAFALAADWRARAFETTEPLTWSRGADTPAGPVTARFTTFLLAPDALPGYVLFCCQQHTPQAVWCDEWMAHPNGAATLLGLRRESPGNPDDLAARYGRLVGDAQVHAAGNEIRVHIGTRQLVFRAGHAHQRTVLRLTRRGGTPSDAGDGRVALRTVPGVELEWVDQ